MKRAVPATSTIKVNEVAGRVIDEVIFSLTLRVTLSFFTCSNRVHE